MATQGVSDVHYYGSTMAGAPTLGREVAGDINRILKACLITGFGDEAPQGDWEIAYEDVDNNLLVLRSLDPGSTRMYLYVDGSNGDAARVCGYETMTAIDEGVNQWGLESGDLLYMRTAADIFGVEPPSPWRLFADSQCFYFFSYFRSATPFDAEGYYFGDYLADDPLNDAHNCAIIASTVQTPYPGGNAFDTNNFHQNNTHSSGQLIARNYGSATPGGAEFFKASSAYCNGPMGGWISVQPAYPDAIFSSIRLEKIKVVQNSGKLVRGYMPGWYMPLVYKTPDDGVIVSDSPDAPGRSVLVIRLGFGSSGNYGRAAIDITGPWRDDGHLGIAGVVTELMVPGAYQVKLFRQSDMQLVKTTWSDGSGAYAFTGLKNQKYVVMAIDHTDPLRSPAIQDNVIPS